MFKKVLKVVSNKMQAIRDERRRSRIFRDAATRSSRAPIHEYNPGKRRYERINACCMVLFFVLAAAAVLGLLADYVIQAGS